MVCTKIKPVLLLNRGILVDVINDAVTEAASAAGTSRRSRGFLSEVPMDLIEKRRGR